MKSVQIQLTSDCNQRCYMCRKYTWAKKEISVDILKEKVEKYRGCTFTFSGGDPLSYSHIAELNQMMRENDVVYQIFTNANYVLDEEQKVFLSNAECVQVSFDGSDDATYNSVRRPVENGADVVLSNLKWIQKNCRELKLNCTLSKRNYFDVMNIVEVVWVTLKDKVKLRFFPVHTDKEAMLEPYMYEHIKTQLNGIFINRFFIENNTNLLDFKMQKFEPFAGKCYVKNNHRVIDEDGIEYTCCRAINDNGCDWKKKFAIENLADVEDENKLYEYCSGCDRYRKFNENWEEYKNKEECFL